MNKKRPPYHSPDHEVHQTHLASPGQGDEGSENGMFEDPLCSLSKSLGIHGVNIARPRGCIGASAQTRVFYPQVTS
jgi:hypothetical protein